MRTPKKFKIIDKYRAELPKLSKAQEEWMLKNAFNDFAFMPGNKYYICGGCHNHFVGNEEYCPHCGQKLTTKRNGRRFYSRIVVATTHKGWQVFRFFDVFISSNRMKVKLEIYEAFQRWMNDKGDNAIFSRKFKMFSMMLNYESEMTYKREIIQNSYYVSYNFYSEADCIYPRQKFIDNLKRNGIKEYKGGRIVKMALSIMNDCKIESLIKNGQAEIAEHIISQGYPKIPEHCVNLALRYSYRVKDVQMWADYIRDLTSLKMDTHNPKILLPEDLETAHQDTINRLRKIREKEEKRRNYIDSLKSAKAKNDIYKKEKGAYLGIKFDDGEIYFSVLQNVTDFVKEGKAMHHCVENYWKHKNSVILSARDGDNNRLETVEVNVEDFSISQARGVCNKPSDLHEKIMKTVSNNMELFRRAKKQNRVKNRAKTNVF